MISQPDRWQRISGYRPAGGHYDLFIAKLMDEQGWQRDFAEQAAREYLRFVYLACVSPTPVTPSQTIDSVWHLHLTFSRDYWQAFCPEVLGRELHHEPSDSDEASLMQQQYRDTLARYEAEFGAPPPPAIWGIRRDTATGTRPATAWLISLTALLGTSAAIAAEAASGGDHDGLIAIGAITLLVLIVWLLFRPKRARRHKGDGGSGCGSICSSGSSCGSSCGGGGD